MMPPAATESLKSMLGDLDPQSEQILADGVTVTKFMPGYAVFREGTAPRNVFLLLSGRIRLSRTAPSGRQEVITFVEPVALFGHVAILGHFHHLTTASAVAASECVAIPASFMLARAPDPGARLGIRLREAAVLGMNQQLRAVNARLLSLSTASQAMDEVSAALGSWNVPET